MLFALFAVAVPPHGILGRSIDHRVFILRRAAGVVPGLGAERATGDNGRLAVADGMLVERGFGEVPVDSGESFEAKTISSDSPRSSRPFLT